MINLEQLGAFSFEEGFSRPDWRLISKAIQDAAIATHDLGEAWSEVATQWLLQLQTDLGGDYRVKQSRRFLLLSEMKDEASEKILDFSETTLDQIRDRLKDAAWSSGHGKHVILLFSEDDVRKRPFLA